MKKTLLATAVAGAIGASAGAAQAATVYNQDGTQLDIYGNVQIAYKSIDQGADSEDELFDNGSTIGFKGQHMINPSLKGYFEAEFEYTADEASGINSGDQAYMGLKGDFGDARLGSWDDLIDDWVQDPISNNEYFDVSDSNDDLGAIYEGGNYVINDDASEDREGDKLQYMSPSFGGLQFAVGTRYKGDAETEFQNSGFENEDSNAAFFGGLKYTAGAFSIAGVYDNLDNYTLRNISSGDEISVDAYGVNAQYTMEALRVSAKVENTKVEYGDEDGDIMRYALGARYGYGMGDVYGSYQRVDADEQVAAVANPSGLTSGIGSTYQGDTTFNEMVVGMTYNISPAMYTFIEGGWYDRTEDVDDGVAVGAVYSF